MTEQFKHISIVDTFEQLQQTGVVIADIRDQVSFNQGHIENAFHLNNDTLSEFVNQVDYEQPVIVVCYHGHSSQGAAQYLVTQGFENVYSMDGGFTAWARQYPYVTGK